MECEKCGGPCWNNSKKNAEREAEGKKPMPLWACKDKDGCGWVKWPLKGQKAAPRPSGGGAPVSRNTRPLGALYNDCMRIAAAVVKLHAPNALPADIVAAGATLFIAASRDGTPLTAPKAQPAEDSDDDGGSMGGDNRF